MLVCITIIIGALSFVPALALGPVVEELILWENMATKLHSIWDFNIIKVALVDAFLKLRPRTQIKNPVMFTVYVGSIITTILFTITLGKGEAPTFLF